MTVSYEWDIETLDVDWAGNDDPDILDHDHRDTLAEFPHELLVKAISGDHGLRLVLVRDDHKDGDIQDRSWAYVENGRLPERFTYCPEIGKPVPARFVRELEANR